MRDIVSIIFVMCPITLGFIIHYYSRNASRLPIILGFIGSCLTLYCENYIKHKYQEHEYQCVVSCEYKKCMNEVQSIVPDYEKILSQFNITLDRYCRELSELQYYFMDAAQSKKYVHCYEKNGFCLPIKLQIEYTDIVSNYKELIDI